MTTRSGDSPLMIHGMARQSHSETRAYRLLIHHPLRPFPHTPLVALGQNHADIVRTSVGIGARYQRRADGVEVRMLLAQ